MSDLAQRLAQLSPDQRARLAERMAASRAPEMAENAIAIVGMACRLPGGANSPSAFWRNLTNGVDAVTPVPRDRWDGDAFFDANPETPGRIATREAAFIDGIANFDAAYFGIAPVEARQMDPQQRLFLEVAMEALETAGLTRAHLAGSMCGVFVGVISHSSEYYGMQVASMESIDTYVSTGTAHSVIANRLSYFLDLRGPSMAIDTACSSSLVALHQACLSLRAGESTVAIVGGVNALLQPEFSVALSKLGVLSPTGRCRTFDASAGGMVRGEGCAAVILKRAADALRDGDPILALVRGSAVNQDGATNGLTAPSTNSQIAVIRAALATAQLDASRISFVETHGTGTTLGDPIEVEAIAATYGAPRPAGDEVILGALKTNIGHLEGAAGLASVIKTVLCLQHRHIPPNLHFTTLNPLVRLDGTSIALATAPREWTVRTGTRVGAVSSFGFGGTNAHAILEEAPTVTRPPAVAAKSSLPLVLSAHSSDALRAQVDRWRAELRTTLAATAPGDLAYTTTLRRTPLAWRVAAVGQDTTTWADRLDTRARTRDHDTLTPLVAGERRNVAFVFCGQGPQWFAMGRELAASEPQFRAVLEQVSAAVERVAGWSLLEELSRDDATSRIHETEVTQPAMFAIQMGLVALWRSWGVEPDFVIGHSMGEIAAACTAGAISLDEGARIAAFRGQAVSQAEGLGSMIAFPISATVAADAMAGLEGRVGIAAINAPESVVLAGDDASLAIVTRALAARGIEGRTLEVRYASHSPQMEPLVGWLRDALGTVEHGAPTLPMFSSISHGPATGAMFDAAHWGVGLRRSVDFFGGVQAALAAGCRAFVDIAPHPVMGGYVRETAAAAGLDVVAVASLRRNTDEREQLLQSAAELFESGVDLRWDAMLGERGTVVNVPAYPWQHERFWIADSAPRPTATRPAAQVRELHALEWHASAQTAPAHATPVRAWIVLGGAPELAYAVAARLGRGDVETRVVEASDVQQAINAAVASGGDVLDLRATNLAAHLTMIDGATASATALRELLADVARRNADARTAVRVWSVTRGAQVVHDESPDARQAAVWGIGRVASVEMADAWGGLVDLDPAAPTAQCADDLLHAVSAHGSEAESVFRNATRHVPRLVPMSVASNAPTLRDDGYYVVTGGLGGVGLVVAEWLAARGARRIVLVGRTALPPRAQWNDAQLTVEQQRRIAGLRRIEACGAEVAIDTHDVSDAAAFAGGAATRRSTGWGTARGILHCATDVQFGLLSDDAPGDIASMMRSKIGGADAMLSAFAADAPDFLVMFSSLADILGERGQGSYAAANAALDAWSRAARSTGAPVSVINWGAWDATGLAASAGGMLVTEELQRRGILGVPASAALAALGAVISQRLPATVVFRTGERGATVTGRDPWRALESLWRSVDVQASTTVTPRDELLTITDSRDRLRRLTTIVHDVVADTLGITDARIDSDCPLGALGMDSLMAIRIRRRCERLFDITLPATTLFSYPTVGALSAFLFDTMSLADETILAGETTPTASDAVPVLVANVSDDDALAQLRARRSSRPRSA